MKKNQMTLEQKVQRALDFQEVANVMSKHMYYHSVGAHREELDKIWAKKTPGASFSQNHGHFVGMESIKHAYGFLNDKKRKSDLASMSKLYPDIENIPENEGIGTLLTHTLTTPIIEIAGDGKTAKGIWYSPGQITEIGPDGKPFSMWMWEKYGVDFAKEEDGWKIWHIHMYYDLAAPVGGKSWAELAMDPIPKDHGNVPEDMPIPDIQMELYQIYSLRTVPRMEPRIPEPYYTFSETFSYGVQEKK